MGIKGLWKELQPVCTVSHISQFKGQKVAVDGYCWLHRAAMASVIPLATGQPCDKFIQFFMARVELLQRFGVIPVLVFDGHAMPMKAGTDRDRGEKREAAKREGLVLLANGRREEAQHVLEKGISITSEIAHACISLCKRKGLQVVVAPYEADAQLAYLCKEGHVQAVVTEDSDLIVYGCGVVIAKMDGQGNCDVLRSRDLPQVSSLAGLSYQAFVWVCIMSGCDYLPSLAGVGIKTATKIVGGGGNNNSAGGVKSIAQIIQHFTQQGFPARELQAYEDTFHKAFYCFAHHLVYDPAQGKIVPFTPLPATAPDLRTDIVGELVEDAELAARMCLLCTIDPRTKMPYTGQHQESVKLYLKRRGGTQKTLAEVGMHVTMQPINGSSNSSGGLPGPTSLVGGVNPVRYAQEGVRTVDVNTGWRKKGGGVDSARQDTPAAGAALVVRYVRSKYFPLLPREEVPKCTDELTDILVDSGTSQVEDDGDDDSQGGPTISPTMLMSEPMLGGADDNDDEDDDEVQEVNKDGDPGLKPKLSQKTAEQLRDVLCPHGYLECGRAHSILQRCFVGHPDWHLADEQQLSSVALSSGTSQSTPPADGDTPSPMMVVARPASMTSPPLGRPRLMVRPPMASLGAVVSGGGGLNRSCSLSQQEILGRQKRERDSGGVSQAVNGGEDEDRSSSVVAVEEGADQRRVSPPRGHPASSSLMRLLHQKQADVSTRPMAVSHQLPRAPTTQRQQQEPQSVQSRPQPATTSGGSQSHRGFSNVDDDEELFPLNEKHQRKQGASATAVAAQGNNNFSILAFSAKQKATADGLHSTAAQLQAQPQSAPQRVATSAPAAPPGPRIAVSSNNNPFASFVAKKR